MQSIRRHIYFVNFCKIVQINSRKYPWKYKYMLSKAIFCVIILYSLFYYHQGKFNRIAEFDNKKYENCNMNSIQIPIFGRYLNDTDMIPK